MSNLVEIKNLSVIQEKTQKQLIKQIDLTIPQGKILGIIGESGSGKSVTMKSIMGILPSTLKMSYDELIFNDDALQQGGNQHIAMIFQDPMTSLNPLRTIEYHLIEVIRRFQYNVSKSAAREIALDVLNKVGILNAEQRLKQYPHELSGGMRQRVMIAMALVKKPKLLIADEPTTALDVTVQNQILKMIKELQVKENLTVAIVTHDFGVVAGLCDAVVVMYQGRIVEKGTSEDIFYRAKHPYTKQLLQAAQLNPEIVIEPVNILDKTYTPVQLSDTHTVWWEVNAHVS